MHILKIELSRSKNLGKRKKREIKIKISMDMNGNTASYSTSTVPKNMIKTDTLTSLRTGLESLFQKYLLNSY